MTWPDWMVSQYHCTGLGVQMLFEYRILKNGFVLTIWILDKSVTQIPTALVELKNQLFFVFWVWVIRACKTNSAVVYLLSLVYYSSWSQKSGGKTIVWFVYPISYWLFNLLVPRQISFRYKMLWIKSNHIWNINYVFFNKIPTVLWRNVFLT